MEPHRGSQDDPVTENKKFQQSKKKSPVNWNQKTFSTGRYKTERA